MAPRKSKSRFTPEEPRQGWAFFESTNTWRKTPSPSGASPDYFPKEWGDWVAVTRPKSWEPDGNTRLNLGSSLHAALATPGSEAGGGGMKTGAGGHPQPYGWHGYYGEAGGGISGGHEVRGKVTPPAQGGKAPSTPRQPLNKGGRVVVTTYNDEAGKASPNPDTLRQKTREQVQAVLDKTNREQVNINSMYRPDQRTESQIESRKRPDPHSEGRAVDINRIDGQKVSDAVNPVVPEQERTTMREKLAELRAAAEGNREVEAYIDPTDGYFRPSDPMSGAPGRKANAQEREDHRHHIHITIRR